MDKIYLGQRLGKFEPGLAFAPYSRVDLLDTNGDLLHTAGNDSGRTLTAVHPSATQEMADSILASVRGFAYTPYTAQEALLDPAAELGDGVDLGGVYSLLAHASTSYGPLCLSDMEAPAGDEIEDEYPYKDPMQRLIERNIQSVRSFITKTAKELSLTVENQGKQLGTTLRVSLDGVTITDAKGNPVTISGGQIDAERLTVKAANISGKLTANQIDASGLKVNAANITGTLTVGSLPDDVALSDEIPTRIGDLTDNVGLVTSSNVTTITNNAIKTASISASQITTGDLNANNIGLNGFFTLKNGSTVYGFIGVNTTKGGAVLSDSGKNNFFVATNSAAKLSYQDKNSVYASNGHIGLQFDGKYIKFPGTSFYSENAATLGTSTYKWGQGYSTASTFSTSDRNAKNSIEDLPVKYLDLFDRLRPVRYKFDDGTSNRFHVGFIAQDVEESMLAAGIDSQEFGGFGKDIHEETGADIYMLRYEEFMGILAAKLQDVDSRVRKLEETA